MASEAAGFASCTTGTATSPFWGWVETNLAVYRANGRLLEKYNVEQNGVLAGGGEYEVQDGFGWTNGVLLYLMDRLDLN